MTLRLALCLGLLTASAARAELPSTPVEVHGAGTHRVAVIEAPVVSGDQYAVTGQVAYEGVGGAGYLEMWNVMPDGSRYFSRTLDERGPLAKLSGSSRARSFVLPFFLGEGAPRPVRLELNVVLPGAGRVTLSELRLASGPGAASTPGAWWTPGTAGWIGAAAGSASGIFGAVIGTLASLGRGRRFAIAGLLALGVAGLMLLAAGLAALALGQPYEVWYPLVLLGVIDPVVAFSLLPTVRRRFAAGALSRAAAPPRG
jgi:hypothetical protein